MDPVSAAGIGMGVVQLTMQVFSACVKGYTLFIESRDMPANYADIRMRMTIEQSRFLIWGEKIGLIQDALEAPSQMLRLNRNLILDILPEIDLAFKSCLAVTSKYDPYIAARNSRDDTTPTVATKSTRATALQKALSIWERGNGLVGRIEWSVIKRETFEKLLGKLIYYNDQIKGLLDSKALGEIREMQIQSNVTLLRMTSQIDELKTLIAAMKFGPTLQGDAGNNISRASTMVENDRESERLLGSLAAWKANYLRIKAEPPTSTSLLIDLKRLVFHQKPRYTGRQIAEFEGRKVWLEWRDTADDFLRLPIYPAQIDERVRELAAILSDSEKPAVFRSPKCIGYIKAEEENKPRYALVNELPDGDNDHGAEFVSLRHLLKMGRRAPPLNARVELARTLAECVLYFHTVDWVHKDIRSDNILFMQGSNRKIRLSEPMFAGFEFSRPALPDEVTVGQPFSVAQAMYRHPDLLDMSAGRSNKSHDLYSLGLVLAEIALWKPIETICSVEVRQSHAPRVKPNMLGEQHGVSFALEDRVGTRFKDAVICCVDGSISTQAGKDPEQPEVGAELARLMHDEVVQVLKSIQI